MGQLELQDFRSELDLVFGDRSFTNENTFYDRWTNFGYLEIVTAIDFEELDEDHTINTSASTQNYAGPTDPIAVKMVRDDTNDRTLDWLDKVDLLRRPAATEGEPLYWTRHIDEIWLHPVPDGAYALNAIHKKTPALLSGDTDVTVLEAGWDQGIIYFAVSHGFMMLGEENRGVAWYNRGLAYAQSRMTEEKFQEGTVGLKASQADLDPGVNVGPANI